MMLKQTHTLIFQYPDDYVKEYEWCKTKDDKWIHKSRSTMCSVYEYSKDFIIKAEQTERSESEQTDCQWK